MGLARVRECFCRKNKVERALLWCVLLLVLVIIVLFLCLLISHDNEICTDPECIRASIHILDTVDPDADPCEDFYAFACGNFVKNAFLKGQPSNLYNLNELTKNQLKQIVIEERDDEEGLPRTVAFQRRFYKACMDSEGIEKHRERIFNLLDEVIGGWPLVKMSYWPKENYDWKKAMVTARKLGLYHQFFLRIDIYQNYTNDKSLLWVRPISPGEITSFHFNDTHVDIMQKIAKELGATSVDIKADLRVTNAFAEQLRSISVKRNNQTLPYLDEERVNISIKDINHKLMKFDWANFLWELTGIHVNDKDKIVFDAKDYLTDLYMLFQRYPSNIQANYIAWILLSTNINYLPETVRKLYQEITNERELPVEIKRSEQCFKLSIGLFPMQAEAEYIRRYTTPEKKVQVQKMIDYIKDEMKDAIKLTDWMDDTSRTNALQRLQNITTYIGWLDVAFNITKLEELTGFYKVKHIPEHSPAIDMARIAIKAKYDKRYLLVRSTWNDLDSLGSPRVDINAYYMREYNLLILPTSIMQGIIFGLHRPYYMNFGALGSVIGHELTHGFSLVYESRAEEGLELWTNETAEERAEIIECVQNDYESFRLDRGKDLDNATSTEENVADFNGVNLAYNAYRRWVRTYGGEPVLPGVQLSPNQIYWIMASTYMCYQPELSDKDTVIGKDKYHGTPEYRVVGRIKNSPYFAHDFNCKEGSKMNPKEKCRIFL